MSCFWFHLYSFLEHAVIFCFSINFGPSYEVGLNWRSFQSPADQGQSVLVLPGSARRQCCRKTQSCVFLWICFVTKNGQPDFIKDYIHILPSYTVFRRERGTFFLVLCNHCGCYCVCCGVLVSGTLCSSPLSSAAAWWTSPFLLRCAFAMAVFHFLLGSSEQGLRINMQWDGDL